MTTRHNPYRRMFLRRHQNQPRAVWLRNQLTFYLKREPRQTIWELFPDSGQRRAAYRVRFGDTQLQAKTYRHLMRTFRPHMLRLLRRLADEWDRSGGKLEQMCSTVHRCEQ